MYMYIHVHVTPLCHSWLLWHTCLQFTSDVTVRHDHVKFIINGISSEHKYLFRVIRSFSLLPAFSPPLIALPLNYHTLESLASLVCLCHGMNGYFHSSQLAPHINSTYLILLHKCQSGSPWVFCWVVLECKQWGNCCTLFEQSDLANAAKALQSSVEAGWKVTKKYFASRVKGHATACGTNQISIQVMK